MLGEIIKGQYQIVQILSSSDYCQTYLAQDLVTPSPQACIVKHLLPGPSGNTSSLSSLRRVFTREVAALEKLSNYSQVPQLLNYFELERQFYLVLEYVRGQPLNRILTPGVRWSEAQVIEFLQEVLTILEVIHAYGLIHRDLKPSNLIQRDSDGKLVLIDFGSVKQAWTQVVTTGGQTNANFAMGIPATMAIGTPGYMPSEQSRGRPRPNSDIYALGMIAIQALTGMQPTMLLEDADSGEVIWQHLTNVTLDLGSILNQMVRHHFTERYQSATEVLADLQPLLLAPTPSQPAPTPISTSPKGAVANASGKQARKTSTGGQQQIALWLGMAIGVTSALGLILGLYYALRPRSKAVLPNTPPKAQFAAIASNRLADRLSLTQTLVGHADSVWAVTVSQDGRTLVSGSADRTIKVWDLPTRQLRHTLTGHTDTVRAIALSPDGQILASGGGEKTVRLSLIVPITTNNNTTHNG
jgi:serine/threonine protein kinase